MTVTEMVNPSRKETFNLKIWEKTKKNKSEGIIAQKIPLDSVITLFRSRVSK